MASPKQITIKETLPELRTLLKKASSIIQPRLRVLIEIKKAGQAGISKRDLAALAGVNHNSVQTWRTIYSRGGIKAICSHNKKGFKKSVFSKEQHDAIEKKLRNDKNGLRGYKELLDWVEKDLKVNVKYNTLLKYCVKNFGSKVKVARKSHISKDDHSVDAFKKTLVISAGKLPVKRQVSTKR